MKVLKFGGTSIGSLDAVNNVKLIVEKEFSKKEPLLVVCSAFSGVTNALLSAAEAALAQNDFAEILKKAEDKHYQIISGLLPRTLQNPLLMMVKVSFNEVEDILFSIKNLEELSDRIKDRLLAYGEQLSNKIIATYLQSGDFPASYQDARELIITDSNFGNAAVDFIKTNENLRNWNLENQIYVVTGFIAKDKNNDTTTLGRGGSDYTAAVLAAGLQAEEIQIWTDVDGFMTADPRLVKNAFSQPELSYQEAMEMSYFGAKVIYPPTMIPAIESQIPIYIKNTFNPENPGTLIHQKSEVSKGLIKGIVSIEKTCLINITGNGMIGMKGFSGRLFNALARYDVNVILITQASSEHSISFVVNFDDEKKAEKAIQEEFYFEMNANKIDPPQIDNELSILSVVGENMKKTRGISGKFFSALGKNGINIIAIAQGSSEINISAVIERNELSKALNVVHDSLLLSPVKTFNVMFAGTGNIGKALFRQLEREAENLEKNHQIKINVVGVTNSRKMIISENESLNFNLNEILDKNLQDANLELFISLVSEKNLPNLVFVDNTSSDEVVQLYPRLFNNNISVVTCNKKGNSSGYQQYSQFKKLAKKNNVSFLYETNVGAGLPIIKTLNDLWISGDEILKIEAILSGTISYIFNNYVGEKTFAEVVKTAQELGFTEPDPRDDLNGMDFSRKMLILGREIGLPLEMSDVEIQDFLPKACLNAGSIPSFYEELEKNETYFLSLKNEAESSGKKLRLIGVLEEGKISIEVKMVDAKHPFFSLSGSDNIISFTTSRYRNTPLVVKGPGAGAEVTAAGVFADLVRVTAQ
ncbi:bifunctional aspartate kinase/homoserine dehydrogenase I [Chryseobacterium sp. SC28]|uniref:bifunctional aspartate kinase/homoserine dehydrogenase I n=1 Tax=Chryseobacterium sp. SC28 TaxID=2268028 RepID=UPI000F647FA0|nr:bifunctional aspartate kinase/homoserine dehydrogenase I [Chryseobacterium sp. SC28]RRQ45906.1 bifunctional aspartate kinase/homoserine dehydrogenase I [Chryseobacterium sp. SC28]